MSNSQEVASAFQELKEAIAKANTGDHDTMHDILCASDRLRAAIDLWYDKCWVQI